jgi:hypothetical protein
MIQLKPLRDFALERTVCQPVRLPFDDMRVAVGIDGSLPHPTTNFVE